jgi:hypothetical protein
MPAGFGKNDPLCGGPSQIVFIGNVDLHDFAEGNDAKFAEHPATAELAVDVLAPAGFELINFQDITVTLEILAPSTAVFADHSNRNNYHWDVPDGFAGWIENIVASTRVRLRVDESRLIAGAGGLTFYVGVSGIGTHGLDFTAVAAAAEVRAFASSCAITVTDMHTGDRLSSYLA